MNLKKIYAIRYLFYLIIIVFISVYLILLTYGYRINWENYSLQKISMMYLASIPRDADIYVNEEFVSDSSPLKIANLFPGRYDVKIENDDYELWEKTMFVEPDYVAQDQDIILILKEKEEVVMEDDKKEAYKEYFSGNDYKEKDKRGLHINNNNEILFEDILISRFSQDIKNAVWYIDKKHIIYQIGNKIYFMDSDGTNNILLVELENEENSKFISSVEGKYLIYTDGDDVKKIKITNIDSLFREKYFNKASKIIK